jgi:SAM-dependent methyltransferase
MSFVAVAKGLASFVLPRAVTNRGGGSTQSARYCYSVYLRHVVQLADAGFDADPRVVAEIGPGESIGTGLAALVAGAERYVGLDIKQYSLRPDAATLFDELVGLFQAQAPVPGGPEMPEVKPDLEDPSFPSRVLTETRLARALDPARLADLRARIVGGAADTPVRQVAPWQQAVRIERGCVDWIFSQAAMEHVDDIPGTYAACHDWLRPGGAMSHQIDLRSHGTASKWNGHWSYSDGLWQLIRGRRLYLVNRQWASVHRAALRATGFAVVVEQRMVRHDGIARNRLSVGFRAMSDDDLSTSGLFVLARRNHI